MAVETNSQGIKSEAVVSETLTSHGVEQKFGKTSKATNIRLIDKNLDVDAYYDKLPDDSGSFFDTKYGESRQSGWYYDNQTNNPLMSVNLMTNSYYNTVSEKWEIDEDGRYFVLLDSCRSILHEDFQVQINNNFSDVGQDLVGDTISSTIRNIAPYANLANEGLNIILSKKNELMKNQTFKELVEDTFFGNAISTGLDKAGKLQKFMKESNMDIMNFLNSKIITQGTQFTYYGGTSINFGNLSIKFTIFPKLIDGIMMSVTDQINELYPYFMGKLVNFSDSQILPEQLTIGDTIFNSNSLNEYIKVQKAPLGYKSVNENIDLYRHGCGQKGTFKLLIGSYYKIGNLVLVDASLSFSKYMTKLYNPSAGEEISPLYCDVILSFRPSTKYSHESLMYFINKNNVNNYKKTTKTKITTTGEDGSEQTSFTEQSSEQTDSLNAYSSERLDKLTNNVNQIYSVG